MMFVDDESSTNESSVTSSFYKDYEEENRSMYPVILVFKSCSLESEFCEYYYGRGPYLRGIIATLTNITMWISWPIWFSLMMELQFFLVFGCLTVVILSILVLANFCCVSMKSRVCVFWRELWIFVLVFPTICYNSVYTGIFRGLKYPYSPLVIPVSLIFEMSLSVILRPRTIVQLPLTFLNATASSIIFITTNLEHSYELITTVLLLYFVATNIYLFIFILEKYSRAIFLSLRDLKRQQRCLLFENEKTTLLLKNILPEMLATELSKSTEEDEVHTGNQCIMSYVKGGSILECDIVDFTSWCSKTTAYNVMRILNKYFSFFDTICEDLGLEKLKTCGDSFTCFSTSDGAKRMVILGICIVKSVELVNHIFNTRTTTNKVGSNNISCIADRRIRVGIVSGNFMLVVSGGTHQKINVDVYGQLTRYSQHVQSLCPPNTVGVDSKTRNQTHSQFAFRENSELGIYTIDSVRRFKDVKDIDRVNSLLEGCCSIFFQDAESPRGSTADNNNDLIPSNNSSERNSSSSSSSSTSSGGSTMTRSDVELHSLSSSHHNNGNYNNEGLYVRRIYVWKDQTETPLSIVFKDFSNRRMKNEDDGCGISCSKSFLLRRAVLYNSFCCCCYCFSLFNLCKTENFKSFFSYEFHKILFNPVDEFKKLVDHVDSMKVLNSVFWVWPVLMNLVIIIYFVTIREFDVFTKFYFLMFSIYFNILLQLFSSMLLISLVLVSKICLKRKKRIIHKSIFYIIYLFFSIVNTIFLRLELLGMIIGMESRMVRIELHVFLMCILMNILTLENSIPSFMKISIFFMFDIVLLIAFFIIVRVFDVFSTLTYPSSFDLILMEFQLFSISFICHLIGFLIKEFGSKLEYTNKQRLILRSSKLEFKKKRNEKLVHSVLPSQVAKEMYRWDFKSGYVVSSDMCIVVFIKIKDNYFSTTRTTTATANNESERRKDDCFYEEQEKSELRDLVKFVSFLTGLFQQFDDIVESNPNSMVIKKIKNVYLFLTHITRLNDDDEISLYDQNSHENDVQPTRSEFVEELQRTIGLINRCRSEYIHRKEEKEMLGGGEEEDNNFIEIIRSEKMRMDVGLAIGETGNGVLGTKKIIFDVFGSTVNSSSRLASLDLPPLQHESLEEDGRILVETDNILEYCGGGEYEEDKFSMMEVGAFELKGKGEVGCSVITSAI